MIRITVLANSTEKQITVNQKHICSFEDAQIGDKIVTEIRMSNGDVWHVTDPPFDFWLRDSWITDTDY